MGGIPESAPPVAGRHSTHTFDTARAAPLSRKANDVINIRVIMLTLNRTFDYRHAVRAQFVGEPLLRLFNERNLSLTGLCCRASVLINGLNIVLTGQMWTGDPGVAVWCSRHFL